MLVQEVVTTIQPLAEQNHNALVVHCADDLGTMLADLTKVRQSLLNLLSNACKFTEQGSITLEVTREAVDTAAWITFRVTDTGIGMTSEQMQKLFQPFVQADASATRAHGGAGLGLAISCACQMVEAPSSRERARDGFHLPPCGSPISRQRSVSGKLTSSASLDCLGHCVIIGTHVGLHGIVPGYRLRPPHRGWHVA